MTDEKHVDLWTPANIVTIARVVLVPLWLVVAEWNVSALLTFVLFVLISASDSLDGYLARSRHEVTDFGKFLDPIADKLVVVVALCYLLEHGRASIWVIFVIVLREFLVSGLRMVVAANGEVVAASMLGKIKTATTLVGIGILLVVPAIPWEGVANVLDILGQITIYAATFFTAWSGVDYFVKCWPYLTNEA